MNAREQCGQSGRNGRYRRHSFATSTASTSSAPSRRARRGFTLIEAIIAIVILALAIPPMVWSLREAHVKRVNPALASQARWLATEKIEDVIADRHSATRGWTYVITANYPSESSVPDYPAFARSVQIVETGPDLATPAPGGGYKRVTVRVQWTDAGASSRALELETVLTEY